MAGKFSCCGGSFRCLSNIIWITTHFWSLFIYLNSGDDGAAEVEEEKKEEEEEMDMGGGMDMFGGEEAGGGDY